MDEFKQFVFNEGKEEGFNEGKEEGFNEGREEGFQEGYAKAQDVIAEQAARIQELEALLGK